MRSWSLIPHHEKMKIFFCLQSKYFSCKNICLDKSDLKVNLSESDGREAEERIAFLNGSKSLKFAARGCDGWWPVAGCNTKSP